MNVFSCSLSPFLMASSPRLCRLQLPPPDIKEKRSDSESTCGGSSQHRGVTDWLVVSTPLKNISQMMSNGNIIPNIYIYMSNLENPRFTERTSTNLGRSHRLPHVCTIMIYGKLGGYRLQETATFIYIYIIHRNQRPIWVSLMWILEKYNDITLKRGIANLGRSHRLPCVFNNFHQFP